MLDRLAVTIGGRSTPAHDDAEAWVRSAVEARWGAESLHELDRGVRQIAFQKATGAMLVAEEVGIPDRAGRLLFYRDGTIAPAEGEPTRRELLGGIFSRYFDGVAVEGPPWRLEPEETDRPTMDEWSASADFDAPLETTAAS